MESRPVPFGRSRIRSGTEVESFRIPGGLRAGLQGLHDRIAFALWSTQNRSGRGGLPKRIWRCIGRVPSSTVQAIPVTLGPGVDANGADEEERAPIKSRGHLFAVTEQQPTQKNPVHRFHVNR